MLKIKNQNLSSYIFLLLRISALIQVFFDIFGDSEFVSNFQIENEKKIQEKRGS